jgi:hypothetical protein
VAAPPYDYQPRDPANSVVYRVVRDHLEVFLAEAAAAGNGAGVPRFVEHAFRAFLRCGWLAGGFARFRCDGCGRDRLVAFSCKDRAICASCGGRRMAERAAHLVDHVLPDVPVRQWVLTVPARLRYQLAWDHRRCRALSGLFVRAVLRQLRERARDAGITGGRGGAVVVIQRFGSALNLNVHFHALVLDGVFAPAADGGLIFHTVRGLGALDAAEVLAVIEARVNRWPTDDARGEDEPDPMAEDAPVLAGLAAASVQGTVALGRRRGHRVRRFGVPAPGEDEERMPDPSVCHARVNHYDLHAGLVVGAGRRDRLEQVCRYVLRPPVGGERLEMLDDGEVRLHLRRPWRDGTTALVFSPLELLERLAVLVPRPRINLVLYYGVLGARAGWRRRLGAPVGGQEPGEAPAPAPAASSSSAPGMTWAALMRRTFGLDVLACPNCGSRLRLVALIEQQTVVARVLGHLALPTAIPSTRPPPHPIGLQVSSFE